LSKNKDQRVSVTEAHVEGAYNNIFSTALDAKYIRTRRSSLIVDPSDGRIPARTPDGEKRRELLRRRSGRSPEAAEEALAAFGEGVTKLQPHFRIGMLRGELFAAEHARGRAPAGERGRR